MIKKIVSILILLASLISSISLTALPAYAESDAYILPWLQSITTYQVTIGDLRFSQSYNWGAFARTLSNQIVQKDVYIYMNTELQNRINTDKNIIAIADNNNIITQQKFDELAIINAANYEKLQQLQNEIIQIKTLAENDRIEFNSQLEKTQSEKKLATGTFGVIGMAMLGIIIIKFKNKKKIK